MKTLLWATVVAGIIGIAAAQTPAANAASELTGKSASNSSTNSMSPQEFAGTWQGLWRNYRPASHSEKGSKTSLSITVRVKTGVNGVLSGTVSTGDFHRELTAEANPAIPLGGAPGTIVPPPPPLPAAPPSGKLLNPRIEDHALAFQVKDAEGKLVAFRLTIQAPDASTLKVTQHSAVYPEFPMKRVE